MRLIALLGAVIVSAAATSAQSPQPPVFRSETELVRITATVMNTRGEPVMDLRKEEFVVLDNGVRQELALFVQDPATPVTVLVLLDVGGSMDMSAPSQARVDAVERWQRYERQG